MKKGVAVRIIALFLLIIGTAGYLFFEGYFLWLSLIGSIMLIAQKGSEPKKLSGFLFVVSVLFILVFAVLIFMALG